ncbi:YceI family protein [Brevibacterium sp. UCMA 11752]|uniref:YceI family protein n=1 Tax=Brevibacterium sp. UCMA 11752 TaxID=2745946 RepID=UPI001F45AE2B|nr:YceI family protein [Brevibacterium sp. UCMA 11752]
MTKTVPVPLEPIGIESDPVGNLRAGLEGTRRIDRKDWGVTWNTKLKSGGVLVSDKTWSLSSRSSRMSPRRPPPNPRSPPKKSPHRGTHPRGRSRPRGVPACSVCEAFC